MLSLPLLASFVAGAIAQGVQYGENQVTVRPDPNIVAANFPDTNISLLAPAFLDQGSVAAGFSNGTQGPTEDSQLGRCDAKHGLCPDGPQKYTLTHHLR